MHKIKSRNESSDFFIINSENKIDCLYFQETRPFGKTKRHGLVLGKRAKEYEGISSEFNDEISRGFGVLNLDSLMRIAPYHFFIYFIHNNELFKTPHRSYKIFFLAVTRYSLNDCFLR